MHICICMYVPHIHIGDVHSSVHMPTSVCCIRIHVSMYTWYVCVRMHVYVQMCVTCVCVYGYTRTISQRKQTQLDVNHVTVRW